MVPTRLLFVHIQSNIPDVILPALSTSDFSHPEAYAGSFYCLVFCLLDLSPLEFLYFPDRI